MVAAVTSNPWLVQMFEVALLRRMCCSGLQGQGEARLAVEIERAADDAPRQLAHKLLTTAEEPGIGSAGGERHAQGLCLAAGDIGARLAPVAGRREQGERDRVDDSDDQGVAGMCPVGQVIDLFEHAEEVGLIDHECRIRTLLRQRIQGLDRGVSAARVEGHLDQLDPLGETMLCSVRR